MVYPLPEAGKRVSKLFESARFDVVVTDYRMPRMNGAELIQQSVN